MANLDEKRRENEQLWFIAQHYFSLSGRLRRKISTVLLSQTVEDFTATCGSKADYSPGTKRTIIFSAHLASSAIRMSTMDENRKSVSGRFSTYYGLYNNDEITERDVRMNIAEIIHFLLRHNIAHGEPSLRNPRKPSMAVFRAYLDKMPICDVYDYMADLIDVMKEEMRS